jgi:hypothetical protein
MSGQNSNAQVIAQINSSTLGTSDLRISDMISESAGSSATVTVSSTGATVTLLNAQRVHASITFDQASAGTSGSPSTVTLAGVGADSWSLTNDVLTLYKGGNVTDTVKVMPDPSGFGVYESPRGVVISSSAFSTPPSGLIPLPSHT